MRYRIQERENYLFAELTGRETSYDMKEFLLAVKQACQKHACPRILLSIRDSQPMFKAEDYGLSGYVNDIVTPSCRIALVGDSTDLHFAHEYIELVARQQSVNLRSFRATAPAIQWLGEPDAAGTSLDALEPAGAPKLS